MSGRRKTSPQRQLDILRELVRRMAEAPDAQALAWTIARATMSALDYEDCVIYFVVPEGDSLVQAAAHGPKSPDGVEIVNPITLEIGEGIVGSCAATAKPIRVHDTALDSRYVSDDRRRGSELAVPIVDRGEVIAVIDTEHTDVGFYTQADEDIVCDIAMNAAARLRAATSIERLQRSVVEFEDARDVLNRRARTDSLTGLLNRRGFEDHMANIGPAQRPISVALIDIDRFKAINDAHGHHCGDGVLKQLAGVISRQTSASGCVAARLGGDEFAVLGHDEAVLQDVLMALLHAVRSRRWGAQNAPLDVSISVGVAQSVGNDVWDRADDALYLAKARGRDQLVVFDPDDPSLVELQSDREWAETIRGVIANDEPALYAQPIVRSEDPDGPAAYHEVLLRHRRPDGQIVSPLNLLSAADRCGLTERLDVWVIDHAFKWLGSRPGRPRLSINVTAPFLISPRSTDRLARAFERSGVKPEQICFEITETMAPTDIGRISRFVGTVRGWGCQVAIDDFGSGWTSLRLARDLDIDLLKIDGEWVREATSDPLAASVVTSVVEAATVLGMSVVAEWVEDLDTMRFAQSLGIEYLQGFLTGVPVPLNDVSPAATDLGRPSESSAGR